MISEPGHVTYRNRGNMRASKSLACVAGGIVVPGVILSWRRSREGFDLLPTFTRLQLPPKENYTTRILIPPAARVSKVMIDLLIG